MSFVFAASVDKYAGEGTGVLPSIPWCKKGARHLSYLLIERAIASFIGRLHKGQYIKDHHNATEVSVK